MDIEESQQGETVPLDRRLRGKGNWLDYVPLFTAAVVLANFIILLAAVVPKVDHGPAMVAAPVTVNATNCNSFHHPRGFPGMADLSWTTITSKAKAQPLNFYLWHPDGSKPRKYIDFLKPKLLELFGINLNTIPALYTGCDKAPMAVACTVADEVSAGKTKTSGSVDLIWINGKNFAEMKKRGLLYGPWAPLIPNAANFDFRNGAINSDKGVLTEGMEFPFHIAQSVFIYDTAKVPQPPKTLTEFVAWIKANPGKFVYADPTKDFTGSAFIRHFFHHDDLLEDFDEAKYLAKATPIWKLLNEIEPFLYQQKAGTPYYPASHNDDIRPLVGNGTVLMDFSLDIGEATARMADTLTNPWPKTMQAYTLDSGSISDTNFLAIPVNAANKEAALVAVNYLASAGAMFSRSRPSVWGAMQAFDPTASSIQEWDEAFDSVAVHYATPTVEELAKDRLGDLSFEYVDRINKDWEQFVKNA